MKKAYLLGIVLSISIFIGASFAAKTSIYFQGGVLSMDQPEVKISKIYGIKIYPTNVEVKSDKDEIFIPHNIENLGNTTNKLKIHVECKSSKGDWPVELIRDDNGDGKHQWLENKSVKETEELGEGAVLHVLLKVIKPENAERNDKADAVLTIFSNYKDGLAYIGNNGVIYGGDDVVQAKDTIIIE